MVDCNFPLIQGLWFGDPRFIISLVQCGILLGKILLPRKIFLDRQLKGTAPTMLFCWCPWWCMSSYQWLCHVRYTSSRLNWSKAILRLDIIKLEDCLVLLGYHCSIEVSGHYRIQSPYCSYFLPRISIIIVSISWLVGGFFFTRPCK